MPTGAMAHACVGMSSAEPLAEGTLRSVADPNRKTCKRYNDRGHAHYLTFSCFQRRPFLSRDRTRRWTVEAIALAREKHQLDLWAWVIMPEHVHLLICPRQAAYDISAILSTVKQSVSKRAVLFVKNEAPQFARWMADPRPDGGQSLRFWQRGGGYDHNMWTPRRIWEKINYIHANPVRRGLVCRPNEWVWSSCRDYAGTREPDWPLPIDRGSLPYMVS
jgi:putative transposase